MLPVTPRLYKVWTASQSAITVIHSSEDGPHGVTN